MSNVLVLGSGGREHALSVTLARSSSVKHVFVCPGNGGTEAGFDAKISNVDIALGNDFKDLVQFIKDEANNIDLVCVGPEAYLVDGIVDVVNAAVGQGICFGPNKSAARLEGSKAFSKDFMEKHNIPTASFKNFYSDNSFESIDYLKSLNSATSIVIKFSGLAAGKGVFLPQTLEEATEILKDIFDKDIFGQRDSEGKLNVVIEERLEGEEISVLCFCDGKDYFIMPYTQDYKREADGDQGLNTGGMGAHSFLKSRFIKDKSELMALKQVVEKEVVQRTLEGCIEDGIKFSGILYAGLMLTKDGPRVLEYNTRFGDPETQVLLPLLNQSEGNADLFSIMKHCADENLSLKDIIPKILFEEEKIGMTLVLASGGYPRSYPKGKAITFDADLDRSSVFHAGTKLNKQTGVVETSGGRVLCVSATGNTPQEVISKVYALSKKIHFDGQFNRSDIGYKMV